MVEEMIRKYIIERFEFYDFRFIKEYNIGSGVVLMLEIEHFHVIITCGHRGRVLIDFLCKNKVNKVVLNIPSKLLLTNECYWKSELESIIKVAKKKDEILKASFDCELKISKCFGGRVGLG
ncbi:hypothetical protein [Vibrio owensii]|uniref:hypothetical protein n=1 Tax=Vibrio owensii TaxID=696485 RepID=UPI0040679E9B